ncbi:Gfo/Idh/MocA family oxidoreductase [Paenibacillus oenotherae]|uniref:Gfo/Idh/MocA family oxidoreductase n=1 Tax=Paenibacillus oenotherae TaxID=1435645 RepID=A0ABS7D9G5_9BACL|nr:Gfo/Idh/MocA family oxidoreductase [Paenibacillus oenotherae]MBW7476501.1 Gfo/Idh/MocA family oxidoreductase [Paenibacillus oenotherae]
MAAKKVNIGIIGAGWIAKRAHLPLLLEMDDVAICGIYDTDGDRAIELAELFRTKAVSSIGDMLELTPDAVIICTPNATHTPLCVQFLKHNISVLCEKPLATSVQDAQQICRAAAASNGVLLTGFVNRYRGDVQRMKSCLLEGVTGAVQTIEAGWTRRMGVPRPGSWFTQKELSGGGVLHDLGSHMIDMMLYLLDAKSASLQVTERLCSLYRRNFDYSTYNNWLGTHESGGIEVEDSARGMVVFSSGATGLIHVSWSEDVEGDLVELKIRGAKGTLQLQTLFGFSNLGIMKEPRLTFMPLGGEQIELELPAPEHTELSEYRSQMNHFIRCVRGEETPLADEMDGALTVNLVDELYKSAARDHVAV